MASPGGTPKVNIEKLVKLLEKQGYSREVISFVTQTATNTNGVPNPTGRVVSAAKQSVQQYAAVADRADDVARTLRRSNIFKGVAGGGLAAAMIAKEISLGTEKTKGAYGGDEAAAKEAVTVRVAVATSLAFLSSMAFKRGNKVAGLGAAAGSGVAVTYGMGQIAMEQVEAEARQKLAEIDKSLQAARDGKADVLASVAEKRTQIETDLDRLRKERQAILSKPIPENLLTRRDELEKELRKLKIQTTVYGIKADSDYGKTLIAQGYLYVGMDEDGDGNNDDDWKAHRRDVNKLISSIEKELAEIKADIRQYTSASGDISKLSALDRVRYDDLSAKITKLETDLITYGNGFESRYDAAIARLEAQKVEYEKRLQGSDIMDDIKAFVTTNDGYNSLGTAGFLGSLSLISGMVLHRSMAAFANEGKSPGAAKAAISLFGHPIGSLVDDGHVGRNYKDIMAFMKGLATPSGVEDALKVAGTQHLDNFRMALQLAYDKGFVPADRYEKVSRMLTMTDSGLSKALLAEKDFVARIAGQVDDSLASASKLSTLGKLKLAVTGGRLGANVTGVGVGIGAGAAGLIVTMFNGQKAYAEALHKAGRLDDAAYKAYVKMSDNARNTILGDTAVSVVDPTGATIVATLGIDRFYIHNAYQKWYDKHGEGRLSKDEMHGLSPSLFPNEAVRDRFIRKIGRYIPESADGQPAILRDVISAKNEFFTASSVRMKHTHLMPNAMKRRLAVMENRAAWRRIHSARDDFTKAIGELGQTPQGVLAYLRLFPRDERLDFVRRLSLSEKNSADFAARHPEVAAYIQRYNDQSWIGSMFSDASKSLKPEHIDRYIMQRFGLDPSVVPKTQVAATADVVSKATGQSGLSLPALVSKQLTPVALAY